ncbi:hypothetical protein [Novosphingobium sediminicola]|uniref:Uncharacterized protein n=1 Tax=Novosphingobium sediminicola TaxID=563162 RepID=A0A7W6CM52_9SPHN|nr:hypothetical protein [Novosphingobium sediminicola]MBB3955506.1 hypothetical protein [Novosphingobium sediminicola]
MRAKLNLVPHPQRATAKAIALAPARDDRFKPFLVPLGDDPVARIKPWPLPVRAACLILGACACWAIPVGAWLLL